MPLSCRHTSADGRRGETDLSALGIGVVGDEVFIKSARLDAIDDFFEVLLTLCKIAGPTGEASLQVWRAGCLVPVSLLRLDDTRGAISVVRTWKAPVARREAVCRAAACLADGGVHCRLLSDGAFPDLDGDDEVLEGRFAEGDDDVVAARRLEPGDAGEVP